MIAELIAEINRERFDSYLIGFTRNIYSSFKLVVSKKYLIFHILMIIITIPLVLFDIDWVYFVFFRKYWFLNVFLFPAVMLGGMVPLIVPPIFYLYGKLKNYKELEVLGTTLTQTGIVALFWSSLYKAFTGRHGPEVRKFTWHTVDYSKEFYFGFLVGGVFDGWPSGHTTISVAIAVCFFYFRPDKHLFDEYDENWITWILKHRKFALVYALYVGFGISTNIHWLSDFVAGIFLGYCVGHACSSIAEETWMKDGELNSEFYENFDAGGFDQSVKYTFLGLFLIVFFSIFIPRKIFNL